MMLNLTTLPSRLVATCALLVLCFVFANAAQAGPDRWRYAWPNTDFSMTSVDFDEIMSGGHKFHKCRNSARPFT